MPLTFRSSSFQHGDAQISCMIIAEVSWSSAVAAERFAIYIFRQDWRTRSWKHHLPSPFPFLQETVKINCCASLHWKWPQNWRSMDRSWRTNAVMKQYAFMKSPSDAGVKVSLARNIWHLQEARFPCHVCRRSRDVRASFISVQKVLLGTKCTRFDRFYRFHILEEPFTVTFQFPTPFPSTLDIACYDKVISH